VMLGNWQAAEDVVQEAFCGLYRQQRGWQSAGQQPTCGQCLRATATPPISRHRECAVRSVDMEPVRRPHSGWPDGHRASPTDAATGRRHRRGVRGVLRFDGQTGSGSLAEPGFAPAGPVPYCSVVWTNSSGGVLVVVAPEPRQQDSTAIGLRGAARSPIHTDPRCAQAGRAHSFQRRGHRVLARTAGPVHERSGDLQSPAAGWSY
jgi:hypothetical protein